MKTILYVFAFGWFLLGLGAVIGGQQFWPGTAQESLPSAAGALDAAGIGWAWVWTFPMPALLAGALGAVLGRLDEIREAIDFSNVHDDIDEAHPEPEERMDPYIGESYLKAQSEEKLTSPKEKHPHF
jgi:hypothetical protein